jgi:YD repeat-containing protein
MPLPERWPRRTVDGARTDYWYDLTGLTRESGAVTTTFLRDQRGRLLSRHNSGGLHNYGRDRLGSVTALTRSSAGVGRCAGKALERCGTVWL